MDVIYQDIRSLGSFGGVKKLHHYTSKRCKDSRLSEKPICIYVTQTDMETIYSSKDLFEGYRRPLPDKSGRLIQLVIVQQWIQIAVELYRCFIQKEHGHHR